jgi:signal transduction histidine kinase
MSSARPETAGPFRGPFGFRLGLWYALLFAVGGAALVVLTYALLASALAQRDRELVLAALEHYVGQYRHGGLAALQEAVASDRVAGRGEGLFVRVLGPGAEALVVSAPSSWSNLDLRRLVPPGPGAEPGWTQVPGPSAVFEVASARLRDGTLFQVGKSSEARADILARYRAQAAFVFVSSLLLAVVGGAIVTRSALAPLRRLSAVLGRIVRTGQVSERVPARGDGDPLDDLSRLFNEMLDRIGTLIAGLRASLDNVAHDLRTPLARLRATAEGALREGEDEEALRQALAACVEECDRVSSTLTTLMDISEAETGTMALRPEPLDAASLLRETAALYEDVAEDKGVALSVESAPGLALSADRGRLRQALANLVDNAVKYTPSGGHVRLVARRDGPRIVFECADDGPGIPPHDLPRIWDRLYRGDRSRSERGLGLGLSLVRAIARAHEGEATVESAPGAGTTFRVVFPASITRL